MLVGLSSLAYDWHRLSDVLRLTNQVISVESRDKCEHWSGQAIEEHDLVVWMRAVGIRVTTP
jgi:hypothetical protein